MDQDASQAEARYSAPRSTHAGKRRLRGTRRNQFRFDGHARHSTNRRRRRSRRSPRHAPGRPRRSSETIRQRPSPKEHPQSKRRRNLARQPHDRRSDRRLQKVFRSRPAPREAVTERSRKGNRATGSPRLPQPRNRRKAIHQRANRKKSPAQHLRQTRRIRSPGTSPLRHPPPPNRASLSSIPHSLRRSPEIPVLS